MENTVDPSQQKFELYNSRVDVFNLPFFTRSQLRQYNGTDKPQIYVAIKGYIYDVSSNQRNYGVGRSYHKLVGKDVSRLLGLNKLQLTSGEFNGDRDAEAKGEWDTSDLTEKQIQTVDKWELFFKKRYRIVGVVIDHQFRK